MKSILEAISLEMIRLDEFHYPKEQLQSKWFGNPPADSNSIEQAEARLQVTFPDDYKEFLSIANGFHAFSDIEPTFYTVESIDYLKNMDAELIKIWRETGNEDLADVLAQSILIAGFEEEQQFLLIPPSEASKNWRYWKFSSWYPGEEPFDSLKDYFTNALEFLKEES
ncbi:SMI1/KNR4 family protein [uncultured Kordia sp.]|uniref:SMI1/KNR4 family protein n=1 Tax=uncultured Kordia sp. TaxID=507699 RepID=UPI00261ED439|nr:SMI1/KNR4 family protein [uncultured Kordia sp.]